MGTTHVNAVDIVLHGDSLTVYIIQDQGEFIGKIKGIIQIQTDKDGNIEISPTSDRKYPITINGETDE